MPGDLIGGRYRIDAVLGRGGTSVVYRATHVHLGQTVAIKVLSAAAMPVPEHVVRLEREARAVSRMKSEHVVRVFDVGKLEDGAPYLVMEHLEGQDLAGALANNGRLPVELATLCIVHACEALAEAHAMGIVHRDLKPANLFLTECLDGSPCIKVLDFGISRTLDVVTGSLTDPGMVLGTPAYMAPEQMESSEAVDPRVDIWALGAIFYELLVGEPPYQGETLPQIFMRIMRSKTPRPSSKRRQVPAVLDAVVARCLAIDPKKRYGSVAELAADLKALSMPEVRDSAARVERVWERHSNPNGLTSGAARAIGGGAGAVSGITRRDVEGRDERTERSPGALFATLRRLLSPSLVVVIATALAAGAASTLVASRVAARGAESKEDPPGVGFDAGRAAPISDDDAYERAPRTRAR